jgi:hypothetical protein
VCFFFCVAARAGGALRGAGAAVDWVLAATVSLTARGSWCGVALRRLRDLAGAVAKPSVFKKAARLAGAGGSGIDET